jgi:hypothetical protein
VKYEHNTIALGQGPAIRSDVSHGGLPGAFALFRDNLCWLSTSVKEKGEVFWADYADAITATNCHHNALANAGYGTLPLSAGTLGAGDVTVDDPRFADPTRSVTAFYWRHGAGPSVHGEQNVLPALDWLARNPARMPEMLDWVFAGFVPRNPALKTASDPDGATGGWIGAMPGEAADDPDGQRQAREERPVREDQERSHERRQ